METCNLPAVEDLLRTALAEDVGGGDVTTRLTIAPGVQGQAKIRAKQAAVIAGVPLIRKICAIAGGEIAVQEHCGDGTHVVKGDIIASLSGPAQALLSVILGFGAGLGFTLLLSAVIPRLGLNLALEISGESLLKVGAVSLVIASFSALLPIRQIAGLDPAIVFRGK